MGWLRTSSPPGSSSSRSRRRTSSGFSRCSTVLARKMTRNDSPTGSASAELQRRRLPHRVPLRPRRGCRAGVGLGAERAPARRRLDPVQHGAVEAADVEKADGVVSRHRQPAQQPQDLRRGDVVVVEHWPPEPPVGAGHPLEQIRDAQSPEQAAAVMQRRETRRPGPARRRSHRARRSRRVHLREPPQFHRRVRHRRAARRVVIHMVDRLADRAAVAAGRVGRAE